MQTRKPRKKVMLADTKNLRYTPKERTEAKPLQKLFPCMILNPEFNPVTGGMALSLANACPVRSGWSEALHRRCQFIEPDPGAFIRRRGVL
ncbi:unnamed protein product, partial [Iphiclides podalirius]